MIQQGNYADTNDLLSKDCKREGPASEIQYQATNDQTIYLKTCAAIQSYQQSMLKECGASFQTSTQQRSLTLQGQWQSQKLGSDATNNMPNRALKE